MSELVSSEAFEAILLVVGVGIAILVSMVKERRCKKCRQQWAFRPNGFTDDVGEHAREEWQCEHCGYREWKPRSSGFTFSAGE